MEVVDGRLQPGAAFNECTLSRAQLDQCTLQAVPEISRSNPRPRECLIFDEPVKYLGDAQRTDRHSSHVTTYFRHTRNFI